MLSLYSFLLKSDTVSPSCVTNGNTILVTKPGCAVFAFLSHCRFHPLHMRVENRIMRCNQSCQNLPYIVQIQAHRVARMCLTLYRYKHTELPECALHCTDTSTELPECALHCTDTSTELPECALHCTDTSTFCPTEK